MAVISSIKVPAGTEYDIRAKGILFGKLDSTSTATAMTATISGITSYYDGLTVYLMNGVVTSASGFTININGLGGKPVYQTMAAATRATTLFNVNYTGLFVYNSVRVDGGCWDFYYGYNSNDNYLAYRIRQHTAGEYATAAALYRYKILLSTGDGSTLLPITSTNATSSGSTNKVYTTADFDPFGEIFLYYATTNVTTVGGAITSSSLFTQYETINITYSFNNPNLTAGKAVYIVAVPQANGKAKLYSTPVTQTLPTTDNGLIYIYLGQAVSATNIAFHINHPIYWYHDGAVRIYTENYAHKIASLYHVDIYVDGTNGVDTNNGVVYDRSDNSNPLYNAVKTLDRALDIAGHLSNGVYIHIVSSGTYDMNYPVISGCMIHFNVEAPNVTINWGTASNQSTKAFYNCYIHLEGYTDGTTVFKIRGTKNNGYLEAGKFFANKVKFQSDTALRFGIIGGFGQFANCTFNTKVYISSGTTVFDSCTFAPDTNNTSHVAVIHAYNGADVTLSTALSVTAPANKTNTTRFMQIGASNLRLHVVKPDAIDNFTNGIVANSTLITGAVITEGTTKTDCVESWFYDGSKSTETNCYLLPDLNGYKFYKPSEFTTSTALTAICSTMDIRTVWIGTIAATTDYGGNLPSVGTIMVVKAATGRVPIFVMQSQTNNTATPALYFNYYAATSNALGTWQTTATTAYVTEALTSYAPKASPTFTGTPAAPTATTGTNTTQIATTAFVNSSINNVKVLYNSGGLRISKIGKLIECVFNNVSSIPTKATIDASTGTEAWVPTGVATRYLLAWEYSSKVQAVITIGASGITAVQNIGGTELSTYRLYGTFTWVTT